MKNLFILLTAIGIYGSTQAQSKTTMELSSGVPDKNLQSILYFDGINVENLLLKGDGLNGKDFRILVREFRKGKLVRLDTVFNSTESIAFRIDADSLQFKVLTKEKDNNEFKMDFQFNGFFVSKKYEILPEEKGLFALKDFCGMERVKAIELNKKIHLLSYMMPYIRKDKSMAYCEVAGSGTDPEKLYEKYAIPHYFLIEISFQ